MSCVDRTLTPRLREGFAGKGLGAESWRLGWVLEGRAGLGLQAVRSMEQHKGLRPLAPQVRAEDSGRERANTGLTGQVHQSRQGGRPLEVTGRARRAGGAQSALGSGLPQADGGC